MNQRNNDDRAKTETSTERTETVDEAVAKLPKAADVYAGDDFSGAKNTGIVNPAPGVWYVLPLDKPEVIKAYQDRGYVTNPPGKNASTGKREVARTHGPCPGHVLMGCDQSIRIRERGNLDAKNANIAKLIEQGTGGGSKEQERGDLERAAVQVTHQGR